MPKPLLMPIFNDNSSSYAGTTLGGPRLFILLSNCPETQVGQPFF
jgi:hypothetical protein